VEELRTLAYEYQERGLGVFLENLALVSDQDTLPPNVPDAPTLLTLHAAKGLNSDRLYHRLGRGSAAAQPFTQ